MEANSNKSLAPLSSQTFTLPIMVNRDAVMASANDIVITGIAEYRFKGYIMTPVGELPITESGRLTAYQALAFLQAALFADNRN